MWQQPAMAAIITSGRVVNTAWAASVALYHKPSPRYFLESKIANFDF